MNLQKSLSAQDTPKLAVAGVLLMSLLLGAHFGVGRVNAQQERQRTIRQMNLEMGRGSNVDTSDIPESTPGAGDPGFIW